MVRIIQMFVCHANAGVDVLGLMGGTPLMLQAETPVENDSTSPLSREPSFAPIKAFHAHAGFAPERSPKPLFHRIASARAGDPFLILLFKPARRLAR